MGRILQQALWITLLGVVFGVAANAVSPKRIPYITPPKVAPLPADYISLEDARQLWQSGTGFFLDARTADDYRAGHIAAAFSLPANEFDSHWPAIAGMLTPTTPIVAYCDGLKCDLSHDLATRLRQLGHTNVRILQNGWTVWRQAGLATSTGGQP